MVVLVGLALWRVGPAPTITLTPSLPAVGPSTEVEIHATEPARGLVGLELELVQGEESWDVDRRAWEPRPFWAFWGPAEDEERWTVRVGKAHQEELVPGPAELRVVARRAPTWLRKPGPSVTTLALEVELTPPDLTVSSVSNLVKQGGSGVVVYRVDESAARHGLRVGEQEIEGFELDAERRFLLFGAPHDLADGPAQMRLFAEDPLGNRIELPFLSGYAERRLPEDDIRLSDGFLDEVVPEILAHTPELTEQESRLDTYLAINGDLRRKNAQALVELATQTRPEFLWQGAFLQLPNSRVMAGYADRRTYLYDGKPVDQQVHLGFDLASHRRAEVPAANRGVVVLAKYFGIYGKTVVLDHGYGLMTLYSHLSEISVEPGAGLDQGDVLGRTGATGLAGGDHLHYSVLIHGTQVDPLEWWDGRWIENRILAGMESPDERD